MNSSTMNSFLIFTEGSGWHMEVVSVSYTYIVYFEFLLNFFMLYITNNNNGGENSLASGRILNFLNNSLKGLSL
jgi:hypothetical protein